MRGKKSAPVKVLDREVPCESLCLAITKADVNGKLAVQFYHEAQQARRKNLKTQNSKTMFKLTTVSDLPVPEVDDDEYELDRIASYKSSVLLDCDYKVIHGHAAVLLARDSGEKYIQVTRLLKPISEKEEFVLMSRWAAKEGLLFPAIRIEIIRTLADTYRIDPETIRLILKNPRNIKPTKKDLLSELRVGRLFEKHPGYTIPFTGFELTKKAFSGLKFLVGNGLILEEMEKGPDQEEHFLRMAISAAETRAGRLQDHVPKCMKYPDTRETLFTQGLTQSKALLKAKYPEENYDQHPQMELQSVEAKMANPEMAVILKPHLEKSPQTNQVLKSLIATIGHIGDISPNARKHIMRALCVEAPEDFADILLEVQPEAFGAQLKARQERLRRAGGGFA